MLQLVTARKVCFAATLSLLTFLMLQPVTARKFYLAATLSMLVALDWLDSDDFMCWQYYFLDLQFLRDHHLLLLSTHHLYSSYFPFSLFTFTWISNLLSSITSSSGVWLSIYLILWLTTMWTTWKWLHTIRALKIILGLMKAKLCLP